MLRWITFRKRQRRIPWIWRPTSKGDMQCYTAAGRRCKVFGTACGSASRNCAPITQQMNAVIVMWFFLVTKLNNPTPPKQQMNRVIFTKRKLSCFPLDFTPFSVVLTHEWFLRLWNHWKGKFAIFRIVPPQWQRYSNHLVASSPSFISNISWINPGVRQRLFLKNTGGHCCSVGWRAEITIVNLFEEKLHDGTRTKFKPKRIWSSRMISFVNLQLCPFHKIVLGIF